MPTPVCSGFPCGSAGKVSAYNAGDLGSIPGLGRSSGEEKGYPLQYSGLENSMAYSPWGCKEVDTTERLSRPCSLQVSESRFGNSCAISNFSYYYICCGDHQSVILLL